MIDKTCPVKQAQIWISCSNYRIGLTCKSGGKMFAYGVLTKFCSIFLLRTQ